MFIYEKTYDVSGYDNGGFFRCVRVDANNPEQARKHAREQGIEADYIREVTIEDLEQEIIDLYESIEILDDF